MEGTSLAIALDKRQDGLLGVGREVTGKALVGVLVLFLAADVGLVSLHELALATNRAVLALGALTEAVKQEPRRFVVRAQHPLQLQGAHALLAGAHEVRREHPLVQGNVRALHHGPDGDGEGLAAILTLVNAGTGARAHELRDPVAHDAALRADRTLRP